MTTDTNRAGELDALTDKDLDAVAGGMDLKGASESMTQRSQIYRPGQIIARATGVTGNQI
jgi:hypothetical protein